MYSKSFLAIAAGLALAAAPAFAQPEQPTAPLNTSAVETFTAKRVYNVFTSVEPFLTQATSTITWTVTPPATSTEN